MCSTQKDPPYKAILRDRRHHSWPSIPLSLRRVFRRRDTPLKLAIRGGHRKRGRQPAGCPSVSVLSPQEPLIQCPCRDHTSLNFSCHSHSPLHYVPKRVGNNKNKKFPCPQNISRNLLQCNVVSSQLGLAWLMMTKRLTSMSVASGGLPGTLIEAQTKEPNFTWKTFNVSNLLTPSKLPQNPLL